MSDQDVLQPVEMQFPDGTSKTFKGTQQQVNAQAKAYWQKSHPAPPAVTTPVTPAGPSRAVIDAYRLQHFNNPLGNIKKNLTGDLSGLSVPEQTAYRLARDPKDAAWNARLKLMSPVGQAAIAERIAEIKDLNRYSKVQLGPGGVPYAEDPKTGERPVGAAGGTGEVHDAVQSLLLGPEGAKQLQTKKGFGAEAERFATGLLDPESLALMLFGGSVAKAGGPILARSITATFAGIMGKGAYDKLRSDDPGGAAADLLIGSGAIAGHALLEKKLGKAKTQRQPPPPNPTTAQVHEPSGLGPEPPRTEPPPTPPGPEPPPKERPATEPPPDTGAQERQRQADEQTARDRQARSEQQARDRQARADQARQANAERDRQRANRERAWGRQPGEPVPPPSYSKADAWEAYRSQHARWRAASGSNVPPKNPYDSYTKWGERRAAAGARQGTGRQQAGPQPGAGQQRARPSTAPPTPEPDAPYVPIDIGTPHPEVDKFNEHAKTYAPNIGETADIVAAKTRLAELVARNKLTVGEKAERIRLDNKINTHISSLQDFVTRFKAATGRDPNVKIGTWSDKTSPAGRAEVLDKTRQVLRSGDTTFEKMFPNAEFDTSAVVPEQPSAVVSRETSKRFSALEDENAKTLEATKTAEAIAPPEPQESATQPTEDVGSSPQSWGFAGDAGRSGDAGVPQTTKLSKSEHQGIIKQLSVPGPKAIYRSASGNVYLNPEATKIVQDVLGSKKFGAATVTSRLGSVETLASILEEGRGRALGIPEQVGKELAFVVREAAKNTPGGAVVFQPYHSPGMRAPYKRFVLHESMHVSQSAVAGAMSSMDRSVSSDLLLSPDQQEHLAKQPGWEEGRKTLLGYGYNEGQIHREIPAYLASGDHARLGISDHNAENIMYHYLYHVLTNYGKDAVATLTARSTGETRRIGRMTGGTPLGSTKPLVQVVPQNTPSEKFDVNLAVFDPLPPKAGSGPVGRVAHHGPEVLNATNKFDAAKVTGPVRAEMMTRDMYDGLNAGEQGLLGEYLVGRRLYGDSVDPNADPADKAAAEAHPRWLDQSELSQIESNPRIKDAIDKWDTLHRPVIDDISSRAGVSLQAIGAKSHHYFPLVPPEFIHAESRTATTESGGYASWESKARPQSSTRRHRAKYSAKDYSTDVGGVLRTVLRLDEPKAALNDLWRTLDTEGLIAFQPSGAAGVGWTKPEGYVGDEIQGKFSSMPADLMALYGGKGKVYLPQDIVQTMDEITKPKTFSGSRGLEVASRISRALISTTLGLNIPAVPFHIYRQTAMFRASTALADAKRNPVTILATSIPVVGTLVKGAVIASRNADDPIYRAIYQHLVEINAISPRSMEGLTLNLGRLPLRERVNAYLHDSMFGVPHGVGVNGWAGRIAVEAYLARGRFEHTDSPERDREYIAQFGAYMQRLSPLFGVLAEFNPFARTHGARIITSLKLATGDTGLRTPRDPGDSETTYRIKSAADRIGALALMVAVPVVGIIVLNKLLSGKYPWENDKGHEFDLNLGHGNFVPLGRLQTELQPALELSGLTSRMHRTRGQGGGGSIPSGSSAGKVSGPPSSNLALEALGDTTIGGLNTVIGMGDSPALNSLAALGNRRMYVTYDKQKKSPNLMQLSPPTATDAQRAVNTLAAITGTSTIIPTQGYQDDGQYNIARGVMDYLTQGAVKTGKTHSKGIKPAKSGRR